MAPSAGLPKRSTPSRAADMMALPSVVGSKRACRFEVLALAAEESEPRPDARLPAALPVLPPPPPLWTMTGASKGEDCGSGSLRGEARCAWNRSTRWD